MKDLVLFGCLALITWLIRRDRARRPGVSGAIWIPTLWLGILASRPLSAWFGTGGIHTLEGSPIDRFFFSGLILASLVVLARRRVPWAALLARNWPLVLFYGFLLVTVLWANSPLSSLKRWTKEFGNILIVLVILTEINPLQAIRAVFVRCAYALVPLSLVFVRYFPELGRRYSLHTGELEVTGVTTQKNSLGAMVLVCGLVFIWDWLENAPSAAVRRTRVDHCIALGLALVGGWLLYLSDSKTSLACLVIGGSLIAAARLPAVQRRLGALGTWVLLGGMAFVLLDWAFGVSTTVIANLGRDMTFTGRTDIWRELLALNTDPVFGTGFMSLWDDPQYRGRLPEWVAFSAHNGYLEIYLAAGALGAALLGLWLFVTASRLNRELRPGAGHFPVVRFAIFVVGLVANLSESNFACMTPLGLLGLIAAIGAVPTVQPAFLPDPWRRNPEPSPRPRFHPPQPVPEISAAA